MTYQRNETPEPMASEPLWLRMAEIRSKGAIAPLLMQDENSGRDGRRYNEWHASRPDARLNAREAAEAVSQED